MIKAQFKSYGSYVTDSVYQWDLNQELQIVGIEVTKAPVIAFSNRMVTEAIPVQSELSNGVIKSIIPNVLLQKADNIVAHLCEKVNGKYKTFEKIVIPVKKRKIPSDYTYMDNVPADTYALMVKVREDLEILNNGGLILKDEIINRDIENWLDEHPEATTTVQDGSLEEKKIHPSFLPFIKKDYVTPQMFGAKGDGVTDDTNAIQSMFDSKASVIFFPKGIYNISKTITITTSCSIKGCSPHSYGSTRLKYVGTEGNKSLIYIENAIVSIEDIEIHGSSCSVKKSDNKGTDGNPALHYIYVEKIPEINGIEFGKNVFGSLVKNVTLLQCSGIGLKSGVFCKLDGINAEYCNLGVYVNTDTQIINCRTSYCKNGYIFQGATQGVNIRADEIVEVGLTLLDTTFIKNCFVDQIGYCGIKLDGCKDSNIEVGVLRCGTYYYQTNYKNVPDDEKWKSCVIAIDGVCLRNNISINARSYWDLDDDGVTNMTKYGLFHLLDGGRIRDTTITLNQANIDQHLSAIKSYAIEDFFSFKGIIKSLKINTTWGEFRYFNYDIPNGIKGVRYINNFRYADVFDPKSTIPEFIGAMVRFVNKLYISYSDYNDSSWFRLNVETIN